MNYQKIYNQLIERAQNRVLDGYCEKHHIIPKSMDGKDISNNLVNLTAREHFIAHYLLAKIHGGTQWYAVIRFKGLNKRYFNARLYETARKRNSEVSRNTKIGKKQRKGKPMSEEHKLKISLALKGIKRKLMTDEHKIKISYALKGRPMTEENKLKTSLGMKAARNKRLIDSVFI